MKCGYSLTGSILLLQERPKRPIRISDKEENVATMKYRISTLFIGFIVVVFISVTARMARATLGESADSVESDRKAYSAVRHNALSRNGYSVQDFTTDGNVVREYI
jgi:hypothetical protein